ISSTSAITTFMPSLTKRSARPRPIPLAAPVTTATFPLSSFMPTASSCRPPASIVRWSKYTDRCRGPRGGSMTDAAKTGGMGASSSGGEAEAIGPHTKGPTLEERIEAARSGMTLALHAGYAPDRMAIASPHGDRTFGELNANANRLVRALRAQGLGAGDSVALMCANRPEFPEVTAACLRMGVRVTPVNWHLTGEEAAYIVHNCEAKAFIADARFAADAAEAASLSTDAKVRLAIAGPIDGFDDYEAVIAPESGDDIDDPVLGRSMLYTSGTTGRPKGVDRPAAAPAGAPNARALATDIGVAAPPTPGTDAHLCTGPLYHAAPLAFSLNAP